MIEVKSKIVTADQIPSWYGITEDQRAYSFRCALCKESFRWVLTIPVTKDPRLGAFIRHNIRHLLKHHYKDDSRD